MIRHTLAAISLVAIAASARDADACSCVPPEAALLSPDRADDVPSNAKIRFEIPSQNGAAAKPIVRVSGSGSPTGIDVKSRRIPGGTLDVLEVTPVTPLAPDTRYEVAFTDPQRHPPTHVVGTFKTRADATADTTPPQIDKMGKAIAEKTGAQMRSTCSTAGPWIVVNDLSASDPGRANAKIVYGVWLGDNAGNVDTTKPPTRILPMEPSNPYAPTARNTLFIGQDSICQFHDFPIPKAPFVWLGIAALDEAGNQSAVKKVRVDLAGARIPP